jgi:hypothetical protein
MIWKVSCTRREPNSAWMIIAGIIPRIPPPSIDRILTLSDTALFLRCRMNWRPLATHRRMTGSSANADKSASYLFRRFFVCAMVSLHP